jgi:hypothetical protein
MEEKMKKLSKLSLGIILLFLLSTFLNAQSVAIGPRLSGNFNIYNAQGATGTWNGLGVGIGGNVDISFSQKLGILVNLTVFDMKNFSNTITNGNVTQETSASMSYLTIDPMFKAEFSGFYMVGGPSVGIKLSSSGEISTVVTGQTPNVQAINLTTNTVKFDIAVGTGYNFKLSQELILGSDLIAYIPLTNTFDAPGVSNSVFTIKLGAALKFKI